MSHLLKMIFHIILMRNRQKIENEISELQSGFMAGKGGREGIFILIMICGCYSEVNQDVYACFIDYEKEFNRVNHENMIKCLNGIGINGKDDKMISKPILDTESNDPAGEKSLSQMRYESKEECEKDVCCHHASLTYTQRPSLDT